MNMATSEAADAPPAKSSAKRGILIGLILAVVLGGVGFFLMYSGMLSGGHGAEPAAGSSHGNDQKPVFDFAFVPIDPLVISLGRKSANRYLKFSGQLEVDASKAELATSMMPRVLDVLNSYLRAVDSADLEDPTALVRLRAQMLRRVQIVTGEGLVRDLLITEFVLN